MNNSIIIDINNISIFVTRKRVKNISFRVTSPNGEVKVSVPFNLSIDEIKQYVTSQINWIEKARNKIILKAETTPKPTYEMYRNFRNSFIPLFEKWEEIMGIKANKVTFRIMKSCWGSCRSQSRSLTFNLNLVTKPTECVEYVIIHELAHIIHPNHSSDFWKLVERYCPDYRRLRSILKN